MTNFLESMIAHAWNRSQHREQRSAGPGLGLGLQFKDGLLTKSPLVIPTGKRTEHVAILGKTGTGKSSLIRHLSAQDIEDNRGFVHFDLHGDTTPYLLRLIAREEARRHEDLSARLIVIEPADPEYSIGLNVLEQATDHQSFLKAAEFAQILKVRWHLESFGARTEELLRNSLLVLCQSRLTLLELSPLLTNQTFRTACLTQVGNQEVKDYFENRYDRASEAQQSMFRDAVLNKITAFTADPHFRHILGQTQSSFSLTQAIDQGYWIILNLDKGRLGEQAGTLGSLFLAQLKNALFARRSRALFTLYCDEIQNLLAFDAGLETLLSEARKFGISICSANQYLEQYPPGMRAAILAIGTHIFFQLSSTDADKIAQALDGGKSLGEVLKNLPARNLVAKIGHERWRRVQVPEIQRPAFGFDDLLNRCRRRWARPRVEIEAEIRRRHIRASRNSEEVLHEWD